MVTKSSPPTKSKEIITDPFHLTQSDGNITATDGTTSIWSDIWKYQVPIGVTHVLKQGHTFSAYIEDDSPAESGSSTCRVQIEVRDSAEQDRLIVFGPSLYVKVKEFQDTNKIAQLFVADPVVVPERYWIVIMVNDDDGIDASDSYFDLYISRARAKVV